MKIYTKKGDTGKTSIIGQSKIDKHNIRIEAYGTIDELNSYIGLVRSYDSNNFEKYNSQLQIIQNNLFKIGAVLATVKKDIVDESLLISDSDIYMIENYIDDIDPLLPELKSFILPGGSIWSAHLQVCRSICRRAERRITSLNNSCPIDLNIIKYVNRLSDYFFILSRLVNHLNKIDDVKWDK
tara:strand:- start:2311 stop:2859 length:549 start_codon:yes stop_codon:yes gene_type:complete